MIKQLMIFCSSDIANVVSKELSASGIQGYMRLAGHGTNVEKKTAFSHDLTWPADVFIIPADETKIRRIMSGLKAYAGKCDMEPCLKMILSSVDELL